MKQEVTLLGGGLAAMSTAWEALRLGYRVTIIWKDRKGAATQAAAGMLSPLSEVDTAEPALIELALDACQQYPKWIKELENRTRLSCGFRQEGTIMVALSRDHMADYHRLEAFHRAHGLKTQWLKRTELSQLEPNLANRQIGGIYAPDDHSVNPRKLYNTLFHALSMSSDVQFIKGKTIEVLFKDKAISHIEVQTDNARIRHLSSINILCDGAWLELTEPHFKLPLRPVKGQYLILKGEELIKHTIRIPMTYMVPRDNGEIYIGASMEEEGFDANITAGATLDLLYQSWQAIRGVYEMDIIENGYGFRPALRDHQPAIGATDIDGLWVNTGHFRHGIMLAPMAAKLCMQSIKEPDKENPFSPLRFSS